jgi:hypothetical protein
MFQVADTSLDGEHSDSRLVSGEVIGEGPGYFKLQPGQQLGGEGSEIVAQDGTRGERVLVSFLSWNMRTTLFCSGHMFVLDYFLARCITTHETE